MKKKKVFKKKLEDFIKDESGNISQDKVLKVGLGTIAALGIMSSFSSAWAIHTSSSPADPAAGTHTCAHASHSSHESHSSY